MGLDTGKAQASCGPQFPHLFMGVGIQLHVSRVTARGELGPQDSWSPPQMECQMGRDGPCLDCHPVLTRNLFLLVHSLRVSGNLAHRRSIPREPLAAVPSTHLPAPWLAPETVPPSPFPRPQLNDMQMTPSQGFLVNQKLREDLLGSVLPCVSI